MQELEDSPDREIHGGQRPGPARRIEIRFRRLDEAVAKIPPGKIVKRLGDIAEPERFVTVGDANDRGVELREQVARKDRKIVLRRVGGGIDSTLHEAEPARVASYPDP